MSKYAYVMNVSNCVSRAYISCNQIVTAKRFESYTRVSKLKQ